MCEILIFLVFILLASNIITLWRASTVSRADRLKMEEFRMFMEHLNRDDIKHIIENSPNPAVMIIYENLQLLLKRFKEIEKIK